MNIKYQHESGLIEYDDCEFEGIQIITKDNESKLIRKRYFNTLVIKC